MSRLFTKAVVAEIDGVDRKSREVAAFFAVYDNRDRVGDISHRGMFAKSIGEGSRLERGLVPTKYNHELLVGKLRSAREESKGCLGVMRFSSDPQSDRIFGMVEDGTLPTFSFKYGVPEGGAKMVREGGVSTRHLYEVELYEAGPVDPDLAANDETHVYGAKGLMELSGSLSALNSLDCDERWARQAMESLTDEERAMLANLASVLDKLGSAARSIMVGDSDKTEDVEDTTYEGKAILRFADAISDGVNQYRLESAIANFSNLPALLKATG